MGWFEGLAAGFSEARDADRRDRARRADNVAALEQKVFSTLMQSEDDEMRHLAFSELLKSAGGPRKKGGLSGWVGEYEASGGLERVRQLANTPVGPKAPAGAPQAAAPQAAAPSTPEPSPEPWAEPAGHTGRQIMPPPPPPGLVQPGARGSQPAASGGARQPFSFGIPEGAGPAQSAQGDASHPRELFLSPQQAIDRDLDTERRKVAAGFQGKFDVLSGMGYEPEDQRRIGETMLTGAAGRERWATGPVFTVVEADPAGGAPFTRRIQTVRSDRGDLVDALNHQPLPPNAQPALPGGNRYFTDAQGRVTEWDPNASQGFPIGPIGRPTPPQTQYTGGVTPAMTDDGREIFFRTPRADGTRPVEVTGVRPPPRAAGRPDIQTAQETLKLIDERAKAFAAEQVASRGPIEGMTFAQSPEYQRSLTKFKDDMAVQARYPNYDALTNAALQGGAAPPDDPGLPIGVRTYLHDMIRKHPNDQQAAIQEVSTVMSKLRAEHPGLDFGRVRQLLNELYGKYGTPGAAAPPSGPPTGGPARPPVAAPTAQPGGASDKRVRLTRAQLRQVAADMGITEQQAEAEARRRNVVIID